MLSKNSLRKIAFWSVSIVLMLSLILGVGLYYLLWTTSGSRFVLEKAKDLASDYVQLDVQIKEGSIGNGFISSGPIKVNVPKIVSVKAESLSSKWSLFRYLTSGTLTVDYIKAPRLEVALANELFLDNEDSEGLSEDRTEDLQIQNSNEPFRLNIPLKAVINHLYAQDFAFLSPIVDVFIGELDLGASCFKDYAGVQYGRTRDVTVHLKYADSVSGEDESKQNVAVEIKGGIKASSQTNYPEKNLAISQQSVSKTSISQNSPQQLIDHVIEKFPTIDLPLDTKLEDFRISHGRYYMDGFDTGFFDCYVNAKWQGHILQVTRLAIANEGGKASVFGSMDFSDYFGLDFKLHVKDSPLPESLSFLNTYFTSFEADAKVKGSLADLQSDIEVQSPKKIALKSSINVLDEQLPFNLSVKSPELSYPFYISKADALDTKYVSLPLLDEHAGTASLSSSNVSLKTESALALEPYGKEFSGKKNSTPDSLQGKTADKTENKIDFQSLPNSTQESLLRINIPSTPRGIAVTDLSFDAKGKILGEHILSAQGILNGYGMRDLALSFYANSSFDEHNPDHLKLSGFYFDSDLNAEISGRIYAGLESLFSFYQELKSDVASYSKAATDEHVMSERKTLEQLSSDVEEVDLDTENKPGSIADDYAVSGQELTPFACNLSLSSSDARGFSPFLHGAFDFATNINITPVNNHTIATIGDLTFKAVLGGLEAKASLKELGFDHHNLSVENLSFKQGENSLVADGLAGADSAVEAKLNFKNLSSLLPYTHGALNGALKLSGDIEHVDLELFLRSREIAYQDLLVRGLTVNARAEAQRKSGSMMLFADTFAFNKALRPSRKCTVDLSGNIQKHHLTLGCAGNNSGFISLQGAFDEENSVWQGELSDLSLATQFHQNISLKNKTDLSFDVAHNSASFGAVELQSNIGVLSLGGGKYENGNLKTTLKLDELDLNAIASLIPNDVKMRGKISFDGYIGLEHNKPYVDLDYSWQSGRLLAAGAFFDFELFKGSVLMRNEDLALDLNAQLRRNAGTINTNLHIFNPQGAKTLRGQLLLENFALNRLGGVGDGFNELEGKANAKLDIAGTLNTPLLYGKFDISGSAEPRYDIGRLDKFAISVLAHGNYGDVNGNIGVNGGVLELKGNFDWKDVSASSGNIVLHANELPLFLMGYGSCFANLNADLSFGEQNIIRGAVTIPKALISVQGLGESGIEPSKDEIIIGSQGGEELLSNSRQNYKVNSDNLSVDLSVDLGSDVKVEAMGLKSDLIGGIKFTKTIDEPEIRALGKISSINGRADFYGHRFLVSYAESVFDGNIANPKINAEVIADPSGIEDEVMAGVRVSGRALDPDILLFSKPAMSQNEILSYLLYGHGLDKNSNDPDSSSMQLLTALGLGTTTGLVNSLAGALGMNNLQFGSSGSGEETQIGVQTYLTNKIMMSYGYGVFTSVGEFKLRYELMRRLYAEFVSSLDQAVDLIYSFEFD